MKINICFFLLFKKRKYNLDYIKNIFNLDNLYSLNDLLYLVEMTIKKITKI